MAISTLLPRRDPTFRDNLINGAESTSLTPRHYLLATWMTRMHIAKSTLLLT